MRFSDVVRLNAPREEVWAFLQEPQTMETCVPGLEQVVVSEGGRVVVGAARISFGGAALRLPARLEWLERSAPQQGTLRVLTTVSEHEIEGTGRVTLAEQADGATELSWEVVVTAPPLIRNNPMLANVVRLFVSRFTKEFFGCVEARFRPGDDGDAPLSRFDTKS